MILKFHAKHFERATLNALPVFAVSKNLSIIKEVIRYDKSEALYDDNLGSRYATPELILNDCFNWSTKFNIAFLLL